MDDPLPGTGLTRCACMCLCWVLGDSMVDNKSVTRLNLSSNCLSGESVSALCAALREKGCSLAVLDLSCNNLEDAHAAAIAEVRARRYRRWLGHKSLTAMMSMVDRVVGRSGAGVEHSGHVHGPAHEQDLAR